MNISDTTNRLNRIPAYLVTALLLSSLTACGGAGSGNNNPDENQGNNNGNDNGSTEVAKCEQVFGSDDVYIVDLSQNSRSGLACTMTSDREEIADCVEDRIRAEFAQAKACLNAFDVFVPGTNQEDGNYQQFTQIISDQPGRTYLSVQYNDNSTLWDAVQYDLGVKDASVALDDLLYTLRTRFDNPDVRVFGHSKGSDAVARISVKPEHISTDFYAFAQPGRTPTALRGSAGNIQKLSNNLVGITWQNDEVKFYSGGSDGLQTPEIWGFPGYVNQAGGGFTIAPMRIDHHNNYGGNYRKEDHPYCATGNKSAMLATAECRKQAGVRYLPYFWGDAECTQQAFDMMDLGTVGERYYIGYSGPRSAGCKDTVSNVSASYELVYRMNLADQDDCQYNMSLKFEGLDFGTNRSNGSTITVSSRSDTSWIRKTGTITLPLHMNIELRTSMDDVSGRLSSCVNHLGAKSEGYVDKLKVTFKHPHTGQSITRTLIGNAEGIEYLWPQILADKNNVGWRKESGVWDLHYGIPPTDPTHGGALMIKGKTDGGVGGVFNKWLHLVD